MMCDAYNGWTNFQTWAAYSWIKKTEIDQLAENASDRMANESDTYFQFVRRMAEWLRQHVKANRPLTGSDSLYVDLLDHAIDAVNWAEIAGTYTEYREEWWSENEEDWGESV